MTDLQKTLLKWICVGFGSFLIMTGVVLTITVGMSINNALTVSMGAALAVLGLFYEKFPKYLKKAANVLIVCGSLFLLAVAMLIRSADKETVAYDEDIMIVLGSGITGEKISPMLKNRLDTALAYYDKNPHAIFIVSGGKGPGEDITEAEAMKRYLVENKVDADRILKEEASKNTYENLKNAAVLIGDFKKAAGLDTELEIGIVTSGFHMYRAQKTAEKMGLSSKAAPAPVAWYLRPGTFLRETLSLLKFWFLKPSEERR